MKDYYKSIEKKLAGIIEAKQQSETNIEAKIQEANTVIFEAQANMAKYVSEGNEEAYKAAKTAVADAQADLEFYKECKKELEKKNSEAAELTASVKEAQDAVFNSLLDELKPLIEKIITIGAEAKAEIERGNDILNTINTISAIPGNCGVFFYSAGQSTFALLADVERRAALLNLK